MRPAALVVAVLALTACGGASEASDLEQAAARTSGGTSRFEMTYSSEGLEFRVAASGLFDYANETGVITAFEAEEAGSGPAEPFPEEIRVLGGTAFAAWNVDGATYWVEDSDSGPGADPTDFLLPLPGGSSPTGVFSLILRSSGSITNLGVEEIRGTETTHYRAQVEVNELIDELPAEKRAGVDPAILDERLPVEVWVDRDSRIRRVLLREEMEENAFMTATFDFFDFGVDVDVEPPPKDKLISQERLDELLGTQGWTESGTTDQCADLRGGAPPEETERFCSELEADE